VYDASYPGGLKFSLAPQRGPQTSRESFTTRNLTRNLFGGRTLLLWVWLQQFSDHVCNTMKNRQFGTVQGFCWDVSGYHGSFFYHFLVSAGFSVIWFRWHETNAADAAALNTRHVTSGRCLMTGRKHWSSHTGVYENSNLLRCHAVLSGKYLLRFRRKCASETSGTI
jgi:hypothetical protein